MMLGFSLFLASVLPTVYRKLKRERESALKKSFVILIHGGAGVISKEVDGHQYKTALLRILQTLYNFSSSSSSDVSAVDIAEYAVSLLEDEPLFNAGKGAVYNSEGQHELEASIMCGKTLQCGAVSLVNSYKNPVKLARAVMDHTPHSYLIGQSLDHLAESLNIEKVPESYYNTETRFQQLQTARQKNACVRDHDNALKEDDNSGKGTVGCVVMFRGHTAAATSTGGMTNKLAGRIGDTPIIGAGTFADDRTCAVSATGHGEEFMRHVASYDVSARIQYGGKTLASAVEETVHQRLPLGSGGMIAINTSGEYSMDFNCAGMFRGVVDSDRYAIVGIWENLYFYVV